MSLQIFDFVLLPLVFLYKKIVFGISSKKITRRLLDSLTCSLKNRSVDRCQMKREFVNKFNLMKKYFKEIYNLCFTVIPSLYYQMCSGVKLNSNNKFRGSIKIIKQSHFLQLLLGNKNGKLIIGNNFKCNNKIKSNSIGLIQPCVFNISTQGSKIQIGNNVGISGSSICATTSVTIGDNVLIGSGCLISDTDSHPIDWKDRLLDKNDTTAKSPITIKDNVFIGARSIILKGVTIGEGAVIGAGSVVSKDVPPHTVVCGNPAKIVKTLQ